LLANRYKNDNWGVRPSWLDLRRLQTIASLCPKRTRQEHV